MNALMYAQLEAWEIPAYRPAGQSTELTLQYAEEAKQRRDEEAKTTKIAQNKVFANQDRNFLSDHAREKLLTRSFTTKEQVAERLALHLLFVSKVTKNDVTAFAKVVDCCYEINLASASIGYNSVLECTEVVDFFQQMLGNDCVKFVSEMVDIHTVKPFTKMGLLTFMSGYAPLFQWVHKPEKDYIGKAAELQIQQIRQEFNEFCASGKGGDSAQDRWNFLTERLKTDSAFLEGLKELKDLISSSIAITKPHLAEIIELVGKSPNCYEFSLPINVADEPGYTEQLKKYGFEQDSRYHFNFERK